MFGSKKTPLDRPSASALRRWRSCRAPSACSRRGSTPSSTPRCARGRGCGGSARWLRRRSPAICSSVIVCLPPSRMLAEANSLIRSAPGGLRLADRLAQLIGVASPIGVPRPPVRSLICRTEVRMRGPGRSLLLERAAHVEIARLADALDRGESASDGEPRVLDRRLEAVLGRLAGVVEPAVLAEVPTDVDVGVDEPRQQRVLRQVVGDRAARLADADDLAAVDPRRRRSAGCRRGRRAAGRREW